MNSHGSERIIEQKAENIKELENVENCITEGKSISCETDNNSHLNTDMEKSKIEKIDLNRKRTSCEDTEIFDDEDDGIIMIGSFVTELYEEEDDDA